MRQEAVFNRRMRRLAATIGAASALASGMVSCEERKPRRPSVISSKKPAPDTYATKPAPLPKMSKGAGKSVPCPSSSSSDEFIRTVDASLKINSVYFWIRGVPHEVGARYILRAQVGPEGKVKDLALNVGGRQFDYRETFLSKHVGETLPFTPGVPCQITMNGTLLSSAGDAPAPRR